MSSGAFLPNGYGQDRDFRLKRVREFRVITNGITDTTTLGKLNKNLDTKPGLVFYKDKENKTPLRPDGAHSQEHMKVYEYEPTFVARTAARRQQNFPGAGVPRDQSNQMTLIPMLSTLNGARGESVADLQRQFMPIGISELTGRDTNTTGLTNVLGGIITIDNATKSTLFTGDYAVAVPPSREEALKLEASAGNLANKNGRVTMVLKKLDPELIDFGKDGTVRRILSEYVLEVAPNGTLKMRTGGIKQKASDTLADNDIAATFKGIVETVRDSFIFQFVASNPGVPPNEAALMDLAAKFVVLSGQPPIGTGHLDKEFVDRIELGSNAAGVKATDADRGILRAALRNLALDRVIAPICKNNPIQKNIQHLLTCKRDLEDSVLGLMVIGAGPGKNGDLHLRAYSH
jgi:hypothetical protein